MSEGTTLLGPCQRLRSPRPGKGEPSAPGGEARTLFAPARPLGAAVTFSSGEPGDANPAGGSRRRAASSAQPRLALPRRHGRDPGPSDVAVPELWLRPHARSSSPQPPAAPLPGPAPPSPGCAQSPPVRPACCAPRAGDREPRARVSAAGCPAHAALCPQPVTRRAGRDKRPRPGPPGAMRARAGRPLPRYSRRARPGSRAPAPALPAARWALRG